MKHCNMCQLYCWMYIKWVKFCYVIEWKQNALLQWQLLPVFVVGKATEETGKTRLCHMQNDASIQFTFGTAQKTGFKTIGSDAGNAKALVLIIKECTAYNSLVKTSKLVISI